MPRNPLRVATIILAGGQGTRLYPLTLHHCKPAVSYGGRYKLIDIPISNSLNSDFRQIFILAQHLSTELQHHIHQTYHFDPYHPGSVEVLLPEKNEQDETQWFLGSADAVRKTLPTLLRASADYFLILCGDQLYNINFQEMIEFARDKQADVTIACLPVPKKEAHRMGLLSLDPENNAEAFHEKPDTVEVMDRFALSDEFYHKRSLSTRSEKHFLGSMGIYVFTRDALIDLLANDPGEDFGKHILYTAIQTKRTVGYIYNGYWEDIGTVISYYEANLVLTQTNQCLNTYDERNPIYTRPTYLPGPKISSTKITQSIICEGCIIEAAEIIHSVIGLRSHIKQGTIIRDSVLMGNHFYMPPLHEDKPLEYDFWIGENCLIEKAIIDEHVRIGNRVRLTNQENKSHYDGDKIFIRDGIIIVTAGAQLPDDFVL
ncbi:MAG: glucose-1-phosphate adenylyltransferase [Chlamydiales bacterium]|nr:glucose-1-phosphate adenylyltransferase [Chlamydiales bacterium]